MKRILCVGMIIVCLSAVIAVPAYTASVSMVASKVAVKAQDYIRKTGKSLGNTIWDNKGSIAVGTTAVAVATNPAPFVEGATTVITGKPTKLVSNQNVGSPSASGGLWYYLFYVAVTVLCIVGVRCAWNYVKDYKNWLPLLIVGLCFATCGVVEAGVFQSLPMAEGIAGVIAKPPIPLPPMILWHFVNFALLILTIII